MSSYLTKSNPDSRPTVWKSNELVAPGFAPEVPEDISVIDGVCDDCPDSGMGVESAGNCCLPHPARIIDMTPLNITNRPKCLHRYMMDES